MHNYLKNFKKIRHSRLLSLTMKNNILNIKGPLGTNYINVPSNLSLRICSKRNFFYVGLGSSKIKMNKQLAHLNSFISIVKASCYCCVFGDLSFLNLEGLGFKFCSLEQTGDNSSYINLVMSLGYSEDISYNVHKKRAKVFIKSSRTLYLYSPDYSYLQNESYSIRGIKKPDKYKQKGFFISKFQ